MDKIDRAAQTGPAGVLGGRFCFGAGHRFRQQPQRLFHYYAHGHNRKASGVAGADA